MNNNSLITPKYTPTNRTQEQTLNENPLFIRVDMEAKFTTGELKVQSDFSCIGFFGHNFRNDWFRTIYDPAYIRKQTQLKTLNIIQTLYNFNSLSNILPKSPATSKESPETLGMPPSTARFLRQSWFSIYNFSQHESPPSSYLFIPFIHINASSDSLLTYFGSMKGFKTLILADPRLHLKMSRNAWVVFDSEENALAALQTHWASQGGIPDNVPETFIKEHETFFQTLVEARETGDTLAGAEKTPANPKPFSSNLYKAAETGAESSVHTETSAEKTVETLDQSEFTNNQETAKGSEEAAKEEGGLLDSLCASTNIFEQFKNTKKVKEPITDILGLEKLVQEELGEKAIIKKLDQSNENIGSPAEQPSHTFKIILLPASCKKENLRTPDPCFEKLPRIFFDLLLSAKLLYSLSSSYSEFFPETLSNGQLRQNLSMSFFINLLLSLKSNKKIYNLQTIFVGLLREIFCFCYYCGRSFLSSEDSFKKCGRTHRLPFTSSLKKGLFEEMEKRKTQTFEDLFAYFNEEEKEEGQIEEKSEFLGEEEVALLLDEGKLKEMEMQEVKQYVVSKFGLKVGQEGLNAIFNADEEIKLDNKIQTLFQKLKSVQKLSEENWDSLRLFENRSKDGHLNDRLEVLSRTLKVSRGVSVYDYLQKAFVRNPKAFLWFPNDKYKASKMEGAQSEYEKLEGASTGIYPQDGEMKKVTNLKESSPDVVTKALEPNKKAACILKLLVYGLMESPNLVDCLFELKYYSLKAQASSKALEKLKGEGDNSTDSQAESPEDLTLTPQQSIYFENFLDNARGGEELKKLLGMLAWRNRRLQECLSKDPENEGCLLCDRKFNHSFFLSKHMAKMHMNDLELILEEAYYLEYLIRYGLDKNKINGEKIREMKEKRSYPRF